MLGAECCTVQCNTGPANLTLQLNPHFTCAAVHVEGIYKDTLILQIMLQLFNPFTHTFTHSKISQGGLRLKALQAPFMENSEDFYKFLIFQACFLPNVFAPAGYVLPVQLHPALQIGLIIKYNDSRSYCFDVFPLLQ